MQAAGVNPWVVRCCLFLRWNVVGDGDLTAAEEVFFGLFGEESARFGVGQLQAVFVDQARLHQQPLLPGLLRDMRVNALAEFARQRRARQAGGIDTKLDAVDGVAHGLAAPWAESANCCLMMRRMGAGRPGSAPGACHCNAASMIPVGVPACTRSGVISSSKWVKAWRSGARLCTDKACRPSCSRQWRAAPVPAGTSGRLHRPPQMPAGGRL